MRQKTEQKAAVLESISETFQKTQRKVLTLKMKEENESKTEGKKVLVT